MRASANANVTAHVSSEIFFRSGFGVVVITDPFPRFLQKSSQRATFFLEAYEGIVKERMLYVIIMKGSATNTLIKKIT
jgi:hypothetical protein